MSTEIIKKNWVSTIHVEGVKIVLTKVTFCNILTHINHLKISLHPVGFMSLVQEAFFFFCKSQYDTQSLPNAIPVGQRAVPLNFCRGS